MTHCHTHCVERGRGIPKEREEEAFESVSVILIIFLSSTHSLTVGVFRQFCFIFKNR